MARLKQISNCRFQIAVEDLRLAGYHMAMPKPNKNSAHRPDTSYEANESQASKAMTVGWSLSVVMVLVCALMAGAARLLYWAQPESEMLPVLEEFAFMSAVVIGIVSLLLLPLVYKVRRIPPPLGLAVFGAVVAAAPLIVLLLRSLR